MVHYAMQMNRLRAFWADYSQSETYFAIRRIHFGIMAPVCVAATIFLIVLRQWFPTVLTGAAAVSYLVGAVRRPWPALERWRARRNARILLCSSSPAESGIP